MVLHKIWMTGVCCSNYLQVTTFIIQECCRQGFIIWCKRKVYLAHILMPIKEDGYNHCFKNWKDFSRGGIHSPNILMTGYLLRTLPCFKLLKDSSNFILFEKMTPTAKDFKKLLVGNGFHFSTAQIRSLIFPILNVFVF